MYSLEKQLNENKDKFDSWNNWFISEFNKQAINDIKAFLKDDEKLILNIHGYVGNGATLLMLTLANQVFDRTKYGNPWLLSAAEYYREIKLLSGPSETQILIDNPFLFVDIVQYLDPLSGSFDGQKLAALDHLISVINKRMERKHKTVLTCSTSLFDVEFFERTNLFKSIWGTTYTFEKKLLETEIKRLTPAEEKQALAFYLKLKKQPKSKYSDVNFIDSLYQNNLGSLFGSLRGVEGIVNKYIFSQEFKDEYSNYGNPKHN